MKKHGINPASQCPLYSDFVSDFAELEQISPPSAHTVLLIAADARGLSTDVIARVAERLLKSGLIYVCAWGPDCERVHDIFDEVHVGDGTFEPDFTLMSTWHDTEPLDDAIWYFLQSAFPLDTELETTSYLAVAVSDKEWAAAIDTAFFDVPAFTSRMLDDEAEPNESP